MEKAKSMIQQLLSEVTNGSSIALERFNSLRDVDAKVRDFALILDSFPELARALKPKFENDTDFQANSRRIRLESLANYCRTALKFLDSGVVESKKQIFRGPSLVKLTAANTDLEQVIQDRWLEAQKCQHVGAYLAAVILMGSILEGLLLARAITSTADAYRSLKAPKDKHGASVRINDWSLNALIDVAVDLQWIKTDRAKFSHGLRESRNVVHPWAHVSTKANFDEATCRTCWHVLNASVEDLLKSL